MKRKQLGVGAVVAVIALLGGALFGGVADAKKGKKKKTTSNVVTVAGPTGAVPNGPTSDLVNPVPFKGTAAIGKAGKKKLVADVDITLSALATPAAGSDNALGDLIVRLTGPNGATTLLLEGGTGASTVSGSLISGLTLSDETPVLTCGGLPTAPPPPPCGDPDAILGPPFTGTAEPAGALSTLIGAPMRGNYILTAFDICGDGHPTCVDSGTVSSLSWSLKVTGEKP